MNIPKDEIIQRLIGSLGYPPDGAELVYGELSQLKSPVLDAFETWWQFGQLPELEIEGYTLQTLMQERHMNPIAALLTLGWLQEDPWAAKKSLRGIHDAPSV